MYHTGELALETGKPVFPLADTRHASGLHGDAYRFYFDTLQDWRRNPASAALSRDQFQELANSSPGVAANLIRLLQAFFETSSGQDGPYSADDPGI